MKLLDRDPAAPAVHLLGPAQFRRQRPAPENFPSEKVRRSNNGRRVFAAAGFGLLVEISTVFTPFFGDLSLISRMAGGILSKIYEDEAGR